MAARQGWVVNIRKFVLGLHSLEELVAAGSLTEHAAHFLEASVAAGLNILVSGGTQAGKTTMLNGLCAAIPARERVVTVEEVFELQVAQPDVVPCRSGKPTSREQARFRCAGRSKEALRMRPSRLMG